MKDDIENSFYSRRLRRTFTNKERLNKKEIVLLVSAGQRIRRLDYSAVYKKNYLPYARLSASLRRKSGNAVYRNHERRIVKEVFRCYKHVLPNVDVLIIKVSSRNVRYQEKKENIISLFLAIGDKV